MSENKSVDEAVPEEIRENEEKHLWAISAKIALLADELYELNKHNNEEAAFSNDLYDDDNISVLFIDDDSENPEICITDKRKIYEQNPQFRKEGLPEVQFVSSYKEHLSSGGNYGPCIYFGFLMGKEKETEDFYSDPRSTISTCYVFDPNKTVKKFIQIEKTRYVEGLGENPVKNIPSTIQTFSEIRTVGATLSRLHMSLQKATDNRRIR